MVGDDAERFLRDFQERLAKFGLEIQPEKTRRIAFGRFAASDCRKRGKGKPETFAFLGFTHYCGTNSKGHFVVWRRTVIKRMRAKLHAIKQELRRKMHESVAQVGAWLKRRAGEPGCARAFSRAALPLLAAPSTSSQSAAEARLGTTAADL